MAKFVVTNELGRLAKWLRIMGYDTAYFAKEYKKRDLVINSLREERIILTRDSRMSKYSGIKMIHINSDFVEEQVREVLNELKVQPDEEQMFSRCVICNEPLIAVEKESVRGKVAPYIYQTQELFMNCQKCDRIYWRGTHWSSAKKLLKNI